MIRRSKLGQKKKGHWPIRQPVYNFYLDSQRLGKQSSVKLQENSKRLGLYCCDTVVILTTASSQPHLLEVKIKRIHFHNTEHNKFTILRYPHKWATAFEECFCFWCSRRTSVGIVHVLTCDVLTLRKWDSKLKRLISAIQSQLFHWRQ